jgi:hypothetical protein
MHQQQASSRPAETVGVEMGRARMAVTPCATTATRVVTAGRPGRRVRQQAGDVVAVMAFSAATSLGTAVLLLLATSVGR